MYDDALSSDFATAGTHMDYRRVTSILGMFSQVRSLQCGRACG
jgi:hypothetical protein